MWCPTHAFRLLVRDPSNRHSAAELLALPELHSSREIMRRSSQNIKVGNNKLAQFRQQRADRAAASQKRRPAGRLGSGLVDNDIAEEAITVHASDADIAAYESDVSSHYDTASDDEHADPNPDFAAEQPAARKTSAGARRKLSSGTVPRATPAAGTTKAFGAATASAADAADAADAAAPARAATSFDRLDTLTPAQSEANSILLDAMFSVKHDRGTLDMGTVEDADKWEAFNSLGTELSPAEINQLDSAPVPVAAGVTKPRSSASESAENYPTWTRSLDLSLSPDSSAQLSRGATWHISYLPSSYFTGRQEELRVVLTWA